MSNTRLKRVNQNLNQFTLPLMSCYALEAELLAAVYAIDKAHAYGWNRIWLESDSTYVVDLFRKKSSDVPWKLLPHWTKCIHQLSGMQFRVSHIFREGNMVANRLSKEAVQKRTENWWFTTPDFCSSLVAFDGQSKENFRFV